MCLLTGEKGSSLDTGIRTLRQNLFREPAVNWEKSSPKWKIICGSVCICGGGKRMREEEERKKIILENNLAKNSVSSLIFLSTSFSKTENSLDQLKSSSST